MEILYEFLELESDASFQLLGTAFNANCTQNVLLFDNAHAKGEIVKASPEEGLWIRKWKMTVHSKIALQRRAAPGNHGKKFSLIYFLNPFIFSLKSSSGKIKVGSRQCNMLLSNKIPMQFTAGPGKPFYVLDITFTDAWLLDQFGDEDKQLLTAYLNKHLQQVSARSCHGYECKLLHDLEKCMQPASQDAALIRSKVYALVLGFFTEVLNPNAVRPKEINIHYDQMVEAESILSQQLQSRPKIEDVAKKVNMSVSTLLRQFKTMYGKTVYEYHVQKKMELAKKMILEEKVAVKEVAKTLGYKQVSPFIESFTKQFGCTPGSMRGTQQNIQIVDPHISKMQD